MDQQSEASHKVIVYSAKDHWHIAAEAAKRATDIKAAMPNATTSDTITAIIMAATATETLINELPSQLLEEEVRGKKSTLPTSPLDWHGIAIALDSLEAEKAQIKSKYLISSLLLPGETLDKGRQPYEDFARLIDLRNALVHQKAQPELFPQQPYKPHKLIVYFEQRGWTYRDGSMVPVAWSHKIKTPEIARWACRASLEIIWNVIDRFKGSSEPVIDRYYKEFWRCWNDTRTDKRVQE